jgi:hypothetical protein
MNTVPVDIFAEDPPASRHAQRPSPEQVRAAAEGTEFRSRAPVVPAAAPVSPAKRGRPRTGRTVPFACRTTQEAHDLFYQIPRAKAWSCGTTFEKALVLLCHEGS